MAPLYRFLWLSDTHIGQTGRYGTGEPAATIAYLNTLSLSFAIVTGDLVSDCTVTSQFTDYKTTISDGLNMPVFNLPGNHDGQSGNHTNYIAALGAIHFSPFTVGPVRFIGIVPSEAADLHATMPQSELDYLEAQLQAVGSAVPLVFSHYPVLSDFSTDCNITTGGADLLTLLQTYGVKGFFSGHVHKPCESVVSSGVTHVNGDGLIPYSDSSLNNGMMIVNVYNSTVTVDYFRGASPWDQYDTSGSSGGSWLTNLDPYYDTITINLGNGASAGDYQQPIDRRVTARAANARQHARASESRQYTRPA